MQKNTEGLTHVTTYRGDKCLGAPEIRCLCIGQVNSKSGRVHEDKRVYFYPEEVFMSEDSNGEKMFFVPAIPYNSDRPSEKFAMPLWMGDFRPQQKRQIIVYGEVNGLEIKMKHFTKPHVAITYNERVDAGFEPVLQEAEEEEV